MKNIFSSTLIGLPSLLLTLAVNPAPTIAQPTWELANLIASKSANNPAEHRKLNQGRTYFHNGQFAQAAQIWQQTAQDYAISGDTLNQALSLNYLSLAYQHLSQWKAAQTAIESSLNLIESAPNASAFEWGQILNTQGRLLFNTGQHQSALATWEQAQNYYQQAEDATGVFMSQINQAQALQGLGFYSRSRTLLEEINQQLATTEDSLVKVGALRNLGINLQLIGDLNTSQELLEESLAIAQGLGNTTQIGITYLSLGNTALDKKEYEMALNYFQKAAQSNISVEKTIQAQLNQLRLHIYLEQWQAANNLAPKLYQQLSQLNPDNASRASVYGAVNLAASWLQMSHQGKALQHNQINQLLAQAVHSAKKLQDNQAQAYALQHWGKLYANNSQLSAAIKLTEQSLTLANQINATHISSQSAWQLGKIFKQQGQQTEAITAYSQAVQDLKTLRGDLVSINPDVQFSFRKSIEPVYRELVSLLLEGNPNQKNLAQARELIESLQLAELDNFFREACLDAQTAQIDEIDTQAAVIYPIILPDRLAVIVSAPGKPLSYHATNISAPEVNETLDYFLGYLNPAFSKQDRLVYFQQVYDWLIKPAQEQQVLADAQTLVFVLDGKLRNIPMATLHDGEQYLIEKYNLSLSIGLQLLEPQPQTQAEFNLMTGGVSEARQGFVALTGVKSEVEQIVQQVPAPVLLNQEFTQTAITQQMESHNPNVVHLATHGQFGSTAEDTFLLTWEDKINVKELDQLLRSREFPSQGSIDLLVLSACQTAQGDDRALLGLAGVAIKSGARSTLGTLWTVRDESTAMFMTKLYGYLQQPGMNKARAVRQAQLDLIGDPNFDEPLLWAPFVLVGNWL